jgi:hypothetical protein
MRLLATIPEIVVPSVAPPVAADDAATATPHVERLATIPPRSARRRSFRVTPKPGFPFVSAAALAVVTAVIWSLVAAREAARPEPRQPAVRLAAEPPTETGALR